MKQPDLGATAHHAQEMECATSHQEDVFAIITTPAAIVITILVHAILIYVELIYLILYLQEKYLRHLMRFLTTGKR